MNDFKLKIYHFQWHHTYLRIRTKIIKIKYSYHTTNKQQNNFKVHVSRIQNLWCVIYEILLCLKKGVINQCKKPWTWRTPINFILRVIYIYDDKYSNHGFHNFSNLNLVSNYKINGDLIIIIPTRLPPLFPIRFLSI